MKIKYGGYSIIEVIREETDPKFYGLQYAKGEHGLFHYIRGKLNEAGFDVIKKRAQKDGHMVGDQYQPYIRTRNKKVAGPHIYITNPYYHLRGADEDWNKGSVKLEVTFDVFNVDGDEEEHRREFAETLMSSGLLYTEGD